MAPLYNMTLYGTGATFRSGKLMVGKAEDYETSDLAELSVWGHPYEPQIEHFLNCIEQGQPVRTDVFEGANSAAAVILAAEAIRSGKPQSVLRFER
jgi:predicted dehydrogenase